MEIERKFLLSKFPHTELELLSSHEVEQGYLSVNPEVRIRSKRPCKTGQEYTLVLKSDGHLSREEIEFELTAEQYSKLRAMIPFQFITKLYQRYKLPDELVAECSVVDWGMESSFMYAEVEFNSEGQALQFEPPACFGAEITYEEAYKMKNYWKRRNEFDKMQRKGGWIGTYTGRKFWPMDPNPVEVCIEDIANALSKICRFNGHTTEFYSVAAHCLNVESFIHNKYRSSRLSLLALLHDAAEAYVCDLVRPVKRFMLEYKYMEDSILDAVYAAFNIKPPNEKELHLIGYADDYLLAVEAKHLMKNTNDWALAPIPETATLLSFEKDSEQYLRRFEQLISKVNE